MENLSLYDITSAFPKLMEQDEITEENKIAIEKELEILLQQKSKNIIGYTRNIEMTIDAMKIEEKRIADMRKKLENRLIKFKDYVKYCMENNGITKIETELGNITIANNPISVEIINELIVPNEFKEEVITTKINKIAIKNHFKETGEIPEGVNINTQNTSLRIR